MNISQFFISRPVFTTLTALGILLFGIVAYRALPVAALPSVDYPTIQVSAQLPIYTGDESAETVMAQRISTVSGVSQVNVFGGQKYAVRVQLAPDALASRGIGVDEVQSASQQNNSNIPTGKLFGAKQAFTI